VKQPSGSTERRDLVIAQLLWRGTWLASALVAAGMILAAVQQFEGLQAIRLSGDDLVKAGVALFILLPVARVVLLLVVFLRENDYMYMAISALVLAIIAAGVVSGL
jgi:uncharacterized membrane protein